MEPGEQLFFSIELIPAEKPIGKLLNMQDEEDIKATLLLLAEALSNQSVIPSLSEVGFLLKEMLNESELVNFSIADYTELADAFRGSSFLFDSVSHPSSVLLPAEVLDEDENVAIYYLHSEGLMNEEQPERDRPLDVKISSTSGVWDGLQLERSKMLTNAIASLYINHQDLLRIVNILRRKITVTAIISDGETIISSCSNTLNRNTLLGLLQKPSEPLMFYFNDFNPYEIEYDSSIRLTISADQGGILSFRRNAKLLYDSMSYPSSLTVEFDETDHIKMDISAYPSDEKIALGGSITYNLDITSDFEEEIDIVLYRFSEKEKEKWSITIPESFHISKDGKITKTIIISSKNWKRHISCKDYDIRGCRGV
jgi:hypothetical protein